MRVAPATARQVVGPRSAMQQPTWEVEARSAASWDCQTVSGRLVQRPVRNSPTQACGVDGVLRPRAPLSVVPTCIVSACFILEGLLRVGRWPGTNATATN